jgi:cardiolipin synthase C
MHKSVVFALLITIIASHSPAESKLKVQSSSSKKKAKAVRETRVLAPGDHHYLAAKAEAAASVRGFSPSRLIISTDNDQSLQEALRMIRDAETGDLITLKTYILANDEATALLDKELISAAKRGVEVKMVLDFFSNFKHIDRLNMLRAQAGRNMDIRFVSGFTSEIILDAIYMTTPCPGSGDCKKEKERVVETYRKLHKEQGVLTLGPATFPAQALLAGIAAKNVGLIKFALAAGGMGKPEGDGGKLGEEQKEALGEFLKMLYRAQVQGNPIDKVKLQLAVLLYDEARDVYNKVAKAIPLSRENGAIANKMWEDVTQFIHHKEIAVIQRARKRVLLAAEGRNWENSYRVNEDVNDPPMGAAAEEFAKTNGIKNDRFRLVEKYLFMDMSAFVTIEGSQGEAAVEAYEKAVTEIGNFRQMVFTLNEANRWLPSNLLNRPDLAQSIYAQVMAENKDKPFEAASSQVSKQFMKASQEQSPIKQRIETEGQATDTKIAKFDAFMAQFEKREPVLHRFVEELDIKKDRFAQVFYIENKLYHPGVAYDANLLKKAFHWMTEQPDGTSPVSTTIRSYDPLADNEAKHNRNIHGTWIDMIKDSAARAAKSKDGHTLYIDQGYILFPANLMKLLGQLISGEIDGSKLDIVILTNSMKTTDLAPINLLAMHQLKAVFDFLEHHKTAGNKRTLRSITLKEQQLLPNGNKVSRHNKAMWDDLNIWLGSANGELRSWEMDFNNGVLVTDAPNLAKKLTEHFNKTVNDPRKTVLDVTDIYKIPHSTMLNEGIVGQLEAFMEKYSEKKIGQTLKARQQEIFELVQAMTLNVYAANSLILDDKNPEAWVGRTSVADDRWLPTQFGPNITCLELMGGSNRGPTRAQFQSTVNRLKSSTHAQRMREWDRGNAPL